MRGPASRRFVAPIVETLRELGASGAAAEVTERVIERCKVTEREQEETTCKPVHPTAGCTGRR